MRRLLVTGGAGFIGTNFVYYWLRRHPDDRILVLDALTYAGNIKNLSEAMSNPQFQFIQGDVRDRPFVTNLLLTESIDTIVHFAAESHVDRSIASPAVFLDTNVMGTFALLEAAREVWLTSQRPLAGHRFHHVSTDEVYGSLGPDEPPFSETTRYDPQSPYAASKAASDHLVRAYGNTYGLNYTISNCSNNYGPYQFPEKLIPLCIVHMLRGRAIPLYGDGRNVRDWLHVDDHCQGIELILEAGVSGQTYNIGGQQEEANLSLVKLLCRLVGEYVPSPQRPYTDLITFVRDRPGHDKRYAIDSSKISTNLGFIRKHSLESGLKETISWYLASPHWWGPLLDDD